MDNQTTTPPVMEPKVSPAVSMPPVQPAAPITPPPVVPPTPPVMPSQNPGGHKEVRLVLPALLLILIIGGAYYWYKGRANTPAPVQQTPTATTTAAVAPNVRVAHTDLTQATTTASKLPEGFPAAIPVEAADIRESYKAVYAGHGVTQYTISYTSLKTKEQIWKIYSDFALANGYKVDTTATSQTQGVFDAKSDKGELNMVVTHSDTVMLVQLTYIERN